MGSEQREERELETEEECGREFMVSEDGEGRRKREGGEGGEWESECV